VRRGTPVVTVGGAGGRRDPAAVETADLAQTSHDPLLQSVRKALRAEYGFPREGLFGAEAVFSREPVVYPQADGSVCGGRGTAANLRLDCRSGFGTATFVTGTFGFVAAARMLERIAGVSAGIQAEGSVRAGLQAAVPALPRDI
jgi:tRNA A37 threonylcarbamoyladenosine dehydratase